jgi:8-oxo-dGTP diphosphatase
MAGRDCVGGILYQDNKVLLGKRSADRTHYPGVWDIIGGHCKYNENLEQALSRELQEEVGITSTKFTHLVTLPVPLPGGVPDYELHVHLVSDWMGKPENLQPHEHSALTWFDLDEACELNLAHPDYPKLFQSPQIHMPETR